MNELLLIFAFILVALFIWSYLINNIKNVKEVSLKPKRKLNKKEANFLAEYFHNKENKPDYDGYVGDYTLPEEVMKIYIRKYSKERGWENE